MSASRAFPRKLAECHEMLAQFTAELAALKQSVAYQLRIVAESQQKHAEEQQKNAGLQESIESVRKELGELRKHIRRRFMRSTCIVAGFMDRVASDSLKIRGRSICSQWEVW